MTKEKARELVRETFEKPFQRDQFIKFIKELLNRIDESGARRNYGDRIPLAYRDFVEEIEQIGKYLTEKWQIMIFIVYLKKETSIERARTMQRNFIAWYLKRGEWKDGALAAFVSPDSTDWRFSLIKMDYKFDEKGKVREDVTPARRWSYLVGTHEKSHTAQSKLAPLIEKEEENPSYEDLEEAFNIEKVTKEFFLEYRRLFIRVKEELDVLLKTNPRMHADFEEHGVNTVDFSKKLLGQIVFLYFLQKKGWFGVKRDAEWGTGSKDFLRELFEKRHGGYDNFFNDILEPLFYDALSRDRSDIDHWNDHFKCRIPFLNGGLFDPINNYNWVGTDIFLPNNLFSNKSKTKVGDIGDGILDVFDRYNFTVREDEPLEKEVAIDPELLGKTYEKFNAIRSDNFEEYRKALKSGKKGEESKFNRQFGVYYTPREIVHYMCRQSLINHLTTELEGKIKKEDIETFAKYSEHVEENEEHVENAGRETYTYKSKMPESIRKNAAVIDRKLAEIKICDPAVGSGAFPVGMMSEIFKVRKALNVYIKDIERTVYHFKRECIENSIYGVDIDPGAAEITKLRLWLSLVVDEDDISQIKPLPNLDYKIICGNSLLGTLKSNHEFPIMKESLLDNLEEMKRLHFNETNPPKKLEFKKKIDVLLSKIASRHSEFDFEVFFSEIFHEKGGFDLVISNPPYITIALGKKQKFFEEKVLSKLKLLYKDIFEYKGNTFVLFLSKALELINDHGILTYIIPNTFLSNSTFAKIRKYILLNTNINTLLNFKNSIFEDAETGGNLIILLNKIREKENIIKALELQCLNNFYENLSFIHIDQKIFTASSGYKINLDISNSALINKISSNALQLDEIADFYNGIKTGDNKRFLSDRKINAMYHPVIRGRDVHKYYIDSHNYYVLFDREKLWSNINEYKLRKNPKIIVRQTGDNITAALDEKSRLTLDTTHLIFDTKIPIKFLLGIINSKLMNWFYSQLVKESGRVFAEVKIVNLKKLPISKNVNISHAQIEISLLIERVLAAKRANPKTDTSKLEHKIDNLVYDLYGLTAEEIKIVEGEQ